MPTIGAGALLSRTTLFRGAGLASRLRSGDEAFGDGGWVLVALEGRLASRCLAPSLAASLSSEADDVDAANTLLLVTREGGRSIAEACPAADEDSEA